MAFDLGDVVPLSFQIRDTTGTLANATTVTLNITQPDQSTAGPFTLTPTTTGVYDYDFVPTLAGRHVVRCVATGANAAAFTDAFDVDDQLGYVISLADAKTHLKLSSTSQDDELRLFLDAVTSVVESIIGPIVTNQHVEILPAADRIVLSRAPVLSVTSIAPTDPGFAGAFVGTYILESATGILRRQGFYPYEPAYAFQVEHTYWYEGYDLTITYTAGRAIVPSAVQVAARMILKQSWETKRGAMPLPPTGGDQLEQVNGLDLLIPQTAMDFLAPFANRGPRIA